MAQKINWRPDWNYSLCKAAEDGNIAKVNEDINSPWIYVDYKKDGMTALQLASKNGHHEIVTLLAKKWRINASSRDGHTALHLACKNGRGKVVDVLLANNANVNVTNKDGKTAEQFAVDAGHIGIANAIAVAKKHATINQKQANSDQQQAAINRLQATVDQLQATIDAQQATIDQLQANSDQQQATIDGQKAAIEQLQMTSGVVQQQLLGFQAMIAGNRLWVVSNDQFTIGKEIGRGAWATVHQARFKGTTVAAKCLHQLIRSEETKILFHREMDIFLECQHSNIVTFLGACLDRQPVILMELMDTNLRNAYEQGEVRPNQIHHIFVDVAAALNFLHTRAEPVIHRDVSSANVLLKAGYRNMWIAKLGDLGTAKIQLQAATPGPGAIAYSAPEVIDPNQHSPKMDVYSFGILIVETITKTHPYNKVDTLKLSVQRSHPQYYQLVNDCTKRAASARQSMSEVVKALSK